MKTNNPTAHSGIGRLVGKIIDNLGRLYQLKEKGVLSDKEFEELKERMKAKI